MIRFFIERSFRTDFRRYCTSDEDVINAENLRGTFP